MDRIGRQSSIGILGAGAGGLMAAHLLREKLGEDTSIVIFEAADRIGGKLQTRTFRSRPVPYEAGAAECYDYSRLQHDPLKALCDTLGLRTRRMRAGPMYFGGAMLGSDADIERHAGPASLAALTDFRHLAQRTLPREAWGRLSWEERNAHPWALRSWQDVLDAVPDEFARRYLQAAVHCNIASEPHATSGLFALENFLMEQAGYAEFRSIEGGMEQLARALAERLGTTRIELGSSVKEVSTTARGGYVLTTWTGNRAQRHEVDALLLALPPDGLGRIDWRDDDLRRAVNAHRERFDRPAHYLRVSMLFERPFWRPRLSGSWFTLEAHGGTCVYDESLRFGIPHAGVLGFLFAGSDALALGNLEARELRSAVIDGLPPDLRAEARATWLESRVHRWAMGLCAHPGGRPELPPEASHRPLPALHPCLLVVGAHLFGSSLNGLLRSAGVATDLLARELAGELARAHPPRTGLASRRS